MVNFRFTSSHIDTLSMEIRLLRVDISVHSCWVAIQPIVFEVIAANLVSFWFWAAAVGECS